MESLTLTNTPSLDPARPSLRPQRIALTVFGILTFALSLLVWFHPTLGYAQGGILNGADLRAPLLAFLWAMFAALAVSSTLVLILLARLPAAVRYPVAYLVGPAAAVLCARFLDHYL